MIIAIVDFKSSTFVWDSFTRFLIKFNYLEIRLEIFIVDNEFVSLAVFIDKNIEIGDKSSTCPTFSLMDCVNTIWK